MTKFDQSEFTASARGCAEARRRALASIAEVSEYLVGSPAFKAGVRCEPPQAGSIPVHLR